MNPVLTIPSPGRTNTHKWLPDGWDWTGLDVLFRKHGVSHLADGKTDLPRAPGREPRIESGLKFRSTDNPTKVFFMVFTHTHTYAHTPPSI